MKIRKYNVGEEAEIRSVYFETTRRINGKHCTREQVERWAPDQVEADWPERLAQKNPSGAEREVKSSASPGNFLGRAFTLVSEEHGLICGAPAPRFHM